MKHGMALLVNQPYGEYDAFDIEDRTYAEAVQSIKNFNKENHDLYVKGVEWKLPSVYLIERMINENQPDKFMLDSPNLAMWKGLQLLGKSTASNASTNRWGLIDAFEDAKANIRKKTGYVHLPDNFWMLETMEYNGEKYALSLCNDYHYPNEGHKEHYYYYPKRNDNEVVTGFMPVLIW
jgi:hypothetical protein